MANPIRRTVTIEPDPAYWQALGEFVEAFARIEHVLYNYLMLATGVQPRIATALFSGTRTLDAMAYSRRIWQVSPPPNQQELEDIFAQITAINTVRSSVVHYASIMTSDAGRISTNWARALTPAHVKEHRVSPSLLQDMAADLDKAGGHLVTLWNAPHAPLAERAKQLPVLADAWRYKRPQGDPNQSPKSSPKAKKRK